MKNWEWLSRISEERKLGVLKDLDMCNFCAYANIADKEIEPCLRVCAEGVLKWLNAEREELKVGIELDLLMIIQEDRSNAHKVLVSAMKRNGGDGHTNWGSLK